MERVIGSHWVVFEVTYEGELKHVQIDVKNGVFMMPLTYGGVSFDIELEKEKAWFWNNERDE